MFSVMRGQTRILYYTLEIPLQTVVLSSVSLFVVLRRGDANTVQQLSTEKSLLYYIINRWRKDILLLR